MTDDRQLQIWFLSTSTEIWGAEKSLMTLGQQLISGHAVRAVLYSSSPELVDLWDAAGGESYLIPRKVDHNAPARSILWLASLLRKAKGKPDVVVIFNLSIAPFIDFLRLRFFRSRLILDLHDYLQTSRGRRRVRWASKRFDKVIAISQFAASQADPQVPTVVITRPIEQTTSPASTSNAKRLIGVIGRVDPDKHLEFLLLVARLAPHLKFDVRGAASQVWTDYATELMREANDNITWSGRVAQSRIFDDLAVVFIPNHEEALGRVVLEAQLAGIPVVAPSHGGTSELVTDGETGYIYSAKDASSAISKLELALRTHNSTTKAARELALVVSDPGRYAKDYLQAIVDGGDQ
ncbi:MAG: glycosyltransferase family 4 protein [Actinomycetota bacterium]